jgi:phage shock protein E
MIFSSIIYTIKVAKQMFKTLTTLIILATSHAWAQGNSQLIIDVRTEGECNAGHLASATHLPLDIFEQNIVSFIKDKQRTVYLYCRSGNRSGKALQIMQDLGYINAKNAGGLAEASELLELKIVN